MLTIKGIGVCLFLFLATTAGATDSTLIKLRSGNYGELRNKISVYYSKGSDKRAEELKKLFTKARKFFRREFDVPDNYSVAVLSKSDWESLTPLPYHAYHSTDTPHVIFIPADHHEPQGMGISGTNDGQVATVTNEKLRQLGYSFDDAEKIMSDFKSIHEAGHLFAENLRLSFFPGKPNKWYNEFMASYLAYSYFAKKEKKMLPVIRTMVEHNLNKDYKPKYTSLEDFELMYTRVGAANYGWYQSKFLELIFNIYANKQIGFIDELAKTTFNKDERIPPQDLIAHLEKISPGFVSWSQQFKVTK